MKIFCSIMFIFLTAHMGMAQVREIEEVLKKQTRCWNVGDLDCFMETYWKSDSLIFVGRNGVTHGWYNTYNMYYQTYPADAMGILDYNILNIRRLSEDSYYVVGKWFIKIQSGALSGFFSLIFMNKDGQWLITVDHSS